MLLELISGLRENVWIKRFLAFSRVLASIFISVYNGDPTWETSFQSFSRNFKTKFSN